MGGPGRPKSSSPRTAKIMVTCTPAEKAAIQWLAEQEEVTVSELLRRMALLVVKKIEDSGYTWALKDLGTREEGAVE